eukprot:symbB.v1.2.023046.t1/scaffold2073.1/size90365/7
MQEKPLFFWDRFSTAQIFRCGGPTTCPGGTPGSCSGGLINTPCSQCPEGATWTGSSCEDCSGWRQVLWVLVVIGIFFAWTLAYYLSTSKVTAKATVLFATTASFGLLVMSMQNMGLIGMMTVEWPLNLRGIFSICQFLLLDIDSYGFSCIAGQSEPIRYLLSALIFPVGLTWLSLCFGISKLFAEKYHWSGPKVLSTMGAFLQVSFSTMSATALSPMMCYKHPNGLRSILKYPGVLCGSSDHAAMLVVAWILLTVFVLGFPAACTFAVLKAPYWSSNDKYQHRVAAIRFLVFRFRMDVWWFGVPLLLRGPLIKLPVVLATDYPPIQVVCIAMILTTMMVLQMLSWPWKVLTNVEFDRLHRQCLHCVARHNFHSVSQQDRRDNVHICIDRYHGDVEWYCCCVGRDDADDDECTYLSQCDGWKKGAGVFQLGFPATNR